MFNKGVACSLKIFTLMLNESDRLSPSMVQLRNSVQIEVDNGASEEVKRRFTRSFVSVT